VPSKVMQRRLIGWLEDRGKFSLASAGHSGPPANPD
jgi:hypothetical protein